MMVSFVVPVRNDAQRLKRCLASIRTCVGGTGAAEIIVVDNGSTDGSPDLATACGARVLVLPGVNVSEMRNRGAAFASGSVLAFVDADHELDSKWVEAVLDDFSEERVGAVGALYTVPPDGTWVQRMYGALRGRTIGRHDTHWLGSGNMAVRREAFDAIRGFDAALVACEDVDFCQRMRAAGWRLVADERLRSVHHGDPNTLQRLFRAERWRGRDNFRVTFRSQITLRDLPSVVTPLLVLAAGATTIVSAAAAWPTRGRSVGVAMAALVLLAAIVLLRACRIASGGAGWKPLAFAQACAVAATYEAARACALITRAGHHSGSAEATPAPVHARAE